MDKEIEKILKDIQHLQTSANTLSQQIDDAFENFFQNKSFFLFSSYRSKNKFRDIQSGIHRLTFQIRILEQNLDDLARLAKIKKEKMWKNDDDDRYAMRIATTEFPTNLNKPELRDWQHTILRNYGRYSSLATLLALPSDKEVVEYFTEYGKELDMLSANNCLVIGIGKGEITQKPLTFDESGWQVTVNEQVLEGYSIRVADLFGIKYSEFPCLIVFKDVRSQDYKLISLKGLSKESISQKLRSVFSTLNDAASNKQDPLNALERSKTTEKINKIGEIAGGELPKFVGDVFLTVIGAALKK